MNRWKRGAAALAGAAVATVVLLPVALNGQERRRPEAAERAADRAVRFAQWSGAQIGVSIRDAEEGAGVIVDDVRDGSPAETAGVKSGDVIVEFDGERVRSSRQFSRLVDETPVGRTVLMVIQRGGQKNTLKVVPESRQFGRVAPIPMERFERFRMPELPETLVRPEIDVFSARAGRLGVQIEDLEDQLAAYFGVKRGVLVTSVAKDSPAERAGIKAGDVITAVAGEPVNDAGDVRRELRRAGDQEITIDLTRDRKATSVKVTLRPRTPSWPSPAPAPPV